MTDIDALTAIITLRFHLVDAPTIGRLPADADNAATLPLLERMRSSGLLSAEDSDRVAAMTEETLASFRYPVFDAAGTLQSETRVGPIVELSETGLLGAVRGAIRTSRRDRPRRYGTDLPHL